MAFPTTGILDDFNRANEGPPPSASWSSSGYTAASQASVVSNEVKFATFAGGGAWGTTFGPDSEGYMTLGATLMSNNIPFLIMVRGKEIGAATIDCYQARLDRIDANPGFLMRINRIDNNVSTTLGASDNDTAGTIASGMKIGLEVVGSTLTTYFNRSGTWTSVSSRSDSTYADAGYVLMTCTEAAASFDDFGGGTIPGPTATVAWITA